MLLNRQSSAYTAKVMHDKHHVRRASAGFHSNKKNIDKDTAHVDVQIFIYAYCMDSSVSVITDADVSGNSGAGHRKRGESVARWVQDHCRRDRCFRS